MELKLMELFIFLVLLLGSISDIASNLELLIKNCDIYMREDDTSIVFKFDGVIKLSYLVLSPVKCFVSFLTPLYP